MKKLFGQFSFPSGIPNHVAPETPFDEVCGQIYYKIVMCKIILIGLLCLSVFCMVPLMGSHHLASDHLHHDAAASCSTCIGAVDMSTIVVLFTLLGLSSLIIPSTPALKLIVRQFHPPRMR